MHEVLGKLGGVIKNLDIKKPSGKDPKITKLVYKKKTGGSKTKAKKAIYTRTSTKTNEKKAGGLGTGDVGWSVLQMPCNVPATLHEEGGGRHLAA